MKPKNPSLRSTLFTTLCVAISLPTTAMALPIIWDGDTSTDFADGLNWTGNAAPTNDVNTDIATFDAATTNQPDLSTGDRSVNGLDFKTAGWTLSGTSSLTLGSGGIARAGNNLITAKLVPSVASTFSTLTATTLTLNEVSPIPTNTPVTLGTSTNAGTITLEGTTDNNSFSPTLAFGTLIVNKASTVGSATSNLTVNAGALVKYGPNINNRGGGRGQIYGALTSWLDGQLYLEYWLSLIGAALHLTVSVLSFAGGASMPFSTPKGRTCTLLKAHGACCCEPVVKPRLMRFCWSSSV